MTQTYLLFLKNCSRLKILMLTAAFTFLSGLSGWGQSIGTATVTGTPVCAGSSVTISFLVTNGQGSTTYFSTSTSYTAYLSTNAGEWPGTGIQTFTSAVAPSSIDDASATITQSIIIPSGTSGSDYYRISVGSTGPTYTGNSSSNQSVAFTVNPLSSISGSFSYYNLANTTLTSGITVELWQNGNQVGSDYPVTNGTYSFAGLCPGTYEIRASSTASTAGAINTTDAGQTNYWPTALYAIEKVRFLAGDVSPDLFISASDAQLIQWNFVNGTPFPGSPWVFWKTGDGLLVTNSLSSSYPTVTLGSSNATVNMYALCAGDFNRSFNPTLKNEAISLGLVDGNSLQIGNNTEFELPVRVINPSEVGAVSLILDYPADLVEVLDISMPGAGGQLDWSAKDNELRISWMSGNPISIKAMQDLLVLKLKTTATFTIGNTIRFTLASDPLNELADAMYEVNGNAALSIGTVESTTTGIDNPEFGPAVAGWNPELTCYPNPFSQKTTLNYTLPFDGKVVLEICNIFGKKVTTLVSETQTRGDHLVKFDAIGLPNGVFTATLRLKSSGDEVVKTIKLINNK